MRISMLLHAPRIPELEVMDESEEVGAYADAAAAQHLARIDSRFVRSVLRSHRARRLLLRARLAPARVRRRGLSYLEGQWRRSPA